MIFAYQDHNSDHSEIGKYWEARERTLFQNICPYCEIQCENFYDDSAYSTAFWKHTLAICLNCGWWSYECNESEDLSGNSNYYSSRAILKKFAIDSDEAPINELTRYLIRHEKQIHNISPKKMEELVESVYREVFGYTIETVSYCRPDRGVDIVCFQNDSTKKYAIQVKRYNKPIELGLIHQFFGAMFDNNFQRGAFVTTSKFQKGCYTVAENIENKSGFEIDLVDGKKFLDFLEILQQQTISFKCPEWKRHSYDYSFYSEEVAQKNLDARIQGLLNARRNRGIKLR